MNTSAIGVTQFRWQLRLQSSFVLMFKLLTDLLVMLVIWRNVFILFLKCTGEFWLHLEYALTVNYYYFWLFTFVCI